MSHRRYPYNDWDDLLLPRSRRPRPVAIPVYSEPAPAPEPEPEPEPEPAPEPAPEPEPEPDDKQRLRSALRELENAKARVERDAIRVADDTRAQLIERLFPVLDNLERCIAAGDDEPGTALLAGVKLVRDQFEKVLASYGVERFDSLGQAFDPSQHDAVAVVAVDDYRSDGVVVDEWQPGYRFGDRVLRPAKVRVGKLAA